MPADDPVGLADALIGSQVGDYRITALLGQGTRGLVYAAEHLKLGHRTACKVLRQEVMRQKDTVERFVQEARQISKIGHRNLIDIFDIGELADGRLYYIMEYLSGRTLTQVLAQGRLGLGEIINLSRQACAGLAAAHAAGLVHRDLCPDNLFLCERPGSAPLLKVVGFGFAKVVHDEANLQLTRQGTLLGTPRYMAPEQITEAPVDARTDVYALGAILFELCTGQPPFAGRSLGEVLEGHLRTPVPRLSAAVKKSGVPAAMQAVLDKALAKSPAERFASADALADALAQLLPRSPWSFRDGWRSAWLPLAALAVLVGIGALGGGYVLHQRQRNRPAAAPDLRALHMLALQVVTQGLGDIDPAVRRQAVIALEQSHDARHKELLAPRLRDADTAVAVAAAHALGEIGNRAAISDLQARLAQPAAPELLAAGGEALLHLGEPAGRTQLARAQEQGSAPQVQLASSLALAEAGDPAAALVIERRLRAAPDSGQTPAEDTLLILTRKARRGDKSAQLRLQELLTAPQAPLTQRLQAASCLLPTGDERARVLLSEVVAAPGPAQFSAAQLLCAADDVSGQPILRKVLSQPSEPLTQRVQAAQGLGSCGDQDDAQALGQALLRGEPSPLLQQAEAGALLRLCSADPNILADQSTGWVQLALADGNPSVRAAGATVLGDLPLSQVQPLISKAFHDPSPEVRQSVASALGRSTDRRALEPLAAALADDSRAVRLQVWRSIAQIAQALTAQVEDGLVRADPIVGLLRQRAAQAVGVEQAAAASALLLAGDSSQRPQVQQALESQDAQVRGIALDAAQADPVLRPKALTRLIDDAAQSPAQRTRAATELVRAGDSRGVPLLREVARQGGADGVAAAVALQPLGGPTTPAAPRERLRELLQSADAKTRSEAVAVLAGFPVEQAVPLLQQQSHDQDRGVREQVARTAAALRGKKQEPAGGPVLRTLLDDPDAGVRAQAGALLAGLHRERPSEPSSVAAGKTAASQAKSEPAGSPKGPRSEDRSQTETPVVPPAPAPLRSEKEQPAPGGAEVPLPSTSGSAKSPTGEEPDNGASLPASAVAQLVQAGIEAFERKDLRRAKKSLEKAATLCGRRREERPSCQKLAFELSYYLARVYDAQESYAEAMTEYEKILAPHFPGKVKAADRAAVGAAVARLASRLGRLRVSKLVAGRCQTINLWMPPGRHRVNVGTGQFVQIRAQEIIEVKGCP